MAGGGVVFPVSKGKEGAVMGSGGTCHECRRYDCVCDRGLKLPTPERATAEVIEAARRVWQTRDCVTQDEARRQYNAMRDLGVALAHLDGKFSLHEA